MRKKQRFFYRREKTECGINKMMFIFDLNSV